jgi:hypothetical protein
VSTHIGHHSGWDCNGDPKMEMASCCKSSVYCRGLDSSTQVAVSFVDFCETQQRAPISALPSPSW